MNSISKFFLSNFIWCCFFLAEFLSGDLSVCFAQDTAPPEIVIQKGHSDSVYSVSLSSDGKIIASGSNDETVKVWDTKTGKLLRTLKGHSGSVFSVSYSPDGKTIASGSWDTQIIMWEMNTGNVLVTLLCLDIHEWIAWTTEGYYDCSEVAARYVGWRIGNQIYSFEQYEKVFHKPDIVRKVLSREKIDPEKIAPPTISIATDTPPHLVFINLPPETQETDLSLQIAYNDDHGFEELLLYVNGRPIEQYQQTLNTGRNMGTFTAQVKLRQNFTNVITARAYDNKRLHTGNIMHEIVCGSLSSTSIPSSPQLSTLLTIPVPQKFTAARDITLDGQNIPDMVIEAGGGEIRLRGPSQILQVINQGLHQLSVSLDNKRQDFYFWKEFEKLKRWEKDNFGRNYALIIGITRYNRKLRDLPEVATQAKELGKVGTVKFFV